MKIVFNPVNQPLVKESASSTAILLVTTDQFCEARRCNYKGYDVMDIQHRAFKHLQTQQYMLYTICLVRFILVHPLYYNFINKRYFKINPNYFIPNQFEIDNFLNKPSFMWRFSMKNYAFYSNLFGKKLPISKESNGNDAKLGKNNNDELNTVLTNSSENNEKSIHSVNSKFSKNGKNGKNNFLEADVIIEHIDSSPLVDYIKVSNLKKILKLLIKLNFFKCINEFQFFEFIHSYDFYLHDMPIQNISLLDFINMLITGYSTDSNMKTKLYKIKMDFEENQLFHPINNYKSAVKNKVKYLKYIENDRMTKQSERVKNSIILNNQFHYSSMIFSKIRQHHRRKKFSKKNVKQEANQIKAGIITEYDIKYYFNSNDAFKYLGSRNNDNNEIRLNFFNDFVHFKKYIKLNNSMLSDNYIHQIMIKIAKYSKSNENSYNYNKLSNFYKTAFEIFGNDIKPNKFIKEDNKSDILRYAWILPCTKKQKSILLSKFEIAYKEKDKSINECSIPIINSNFTLPIGNNKFEVLNIPLSTMVEIKLNNKLQVLKYFKDSDSKDYDFISEYNNNSKSNSFKSIINGSSNRTIETRLNNVNLNLSNIESDETLLKTETGKNDNGDGNGNDNENNKENKSVKINSECKDSTQNDIRKLEKLVKNGPKLSLEHHLAIKKAKEVEQSKDKDKGKDTAIGNDKIGDNVNNSSFDFSFSIEPDERKLNNEKVDTEAIEDVRRDESTNNVLSDEPRVKPFDPFEWDKQMMKDFEVDNIFFGMDYVEMGQKLRELEQECLAAHCEEPDKNSTSTLHKEAGKEEEEEVLS